MARPVDYAALTEFHCSTCKSTKPVSEFYKVKDVSAPLTGWRYKGTCRECNKAQCRDYGARNKPRRNARLRAWRKANPALARAKDRRASLAANYGLTEDQRALMVARYDGRCWVCRVKPARAIDHDHRTGRVRGMTCHGCNTVVLSRIDADPGFLDKVASYLACTDALSAAAGEEP